MRELVIVIVDLYLPGAPLAAASVPALPGIAELVRFGTANRLADGWRSWLARRLGRDDLAVLPPACVAACSGAHFGRERNPDGTAWIVTPVHFIAGFSNLHLDNRGLLQVAPATLATLARDFATTFAGSGYALEPLASGDCLGVGPALGAVTTIEPARCIGSSVLDALARGPDAKTLQQLGAEIEMWLYSHPVNATRELAGERPISSLWFWGGGPRCAVAAAAPRPPGARFAAFGTDPYVEGLCRLLSAQSGALPTSFSALASCEAEEVAVTIAVSPLLATEPHATLADTIAQLDRHWLQPAVAMLRSGGMERLSLIANDRHLTLRRLDRLRRWRRARPALAGLQ